MAAKDGLSPCDSNNVGLTRMTWVAGADGFKSRWLVVLWHLDSGELRPRVVASFAGLLTLTEHPAILCVDIPIGLPATTLPGGRACEREARAVLGPRRSSVFSAVGRDALASPSRVEAHQTSRSAGGIGIGAQAWGLAHKLKDADAAMTPARQSIVHEVHPEVSFWAMRGGTPMRDSKKTPSGSAERRAALEGGGLPADQLRQHMALLKSGHDDFLDACAAAWTARRILLGQAGRFPLTPERDERGLDMTIWY